MHHLRAFLLSAAVLLLLAACAAAPPQTAAPGAPAFSHAETGKATPWTHTDFDAAPGKFTFALFSDLTGGEREGVFDVAIEDLRLLRPELILSVGDLIEGGTTDRAELEQEWDSFDERAGRARGPVFRTPGNHDLTNPVMWQVWEQRYGKRYYWFIYKDVLFLVLDTEDNPEEFQWKLSDIRARSLEIVARDGWGVFENTEYGRTEERKSGRISAEQAAWARGVIAAHPAVRWTFVLMHKPAWERPDEENFASIEAALAGRPYTVFYGHVHSYLYERRHGNDYIRLGTTGGVQNAAKDMAVDHVTLVTVAGSGVDIANLRLSGIFDKTGKIPAGGERLCFAAARCGADPE